jgi:hypothetical protein
VIDPVHTRPRRLSAAAGAAVGPQAQFKTALETVYAENNPSKVGEVGALLKTYEGNEQQVLK